VKAVILQPVLVGNVGKLYCNNCLFADHAGGELCTLFIRYRDTSEKRPFRYLRLRQCVSTVVPSSPSTERALRDLREKRCRT
jgi:hypothetical protein